MNAVLLERMLVEAPTLTVKSRYSPQERLAGGIHGEDRLARRTFFGFVRLSAGAVCVEPGAARGSAHVSTVAAVAKRWAKEHASGFAVLELGEFDSGVM
ncbi:hypothetical protein [Caballeronia ptereochthonis]|uniref:Diguanylate cyclase/phosphodiesterase n=1 Tax=Caballeronia ptereochthonis TaxID=1777144 RepID=A0A157ZKB7_9BURK|nr:hypothetical protein [Caballeronia ptereochthonis]SAK45889.1 diguanylate cyclase/phosphodiesterase [Caballeronia ptereochthonis]